MHEDWLKREISSATSAAARLLRRNAPQVELPLAPLTAGQDPPPQAGLPPVSPRRAARRHRKRAARR